MPKSTFEMTKDELRALKLFWPESLSDDQLAVEYAWLQRHADFDHTRGLVEDELARRQHEKT